MMRGGSQTLDRTLAVLPAIRAQIARGLSWNEIAEELGMSKSQVVGICHRHLRAEWAARPAPRDPGFAYQRTEGRPPPRPRDIRRRARAAAGDDPLSMPLRTPGWALTPVPPARACQWPMTPWRRPWPFCGARVVPGKPYCECHVALAYTRRRLEDAA